MTKPENDSPAMIAATRQSARSYHLQMALDAADEPRDRLVIATEDGRTLDFMPDKRLGLDVGDSPKHWSRERAEIVVAQWNKEALEKDRVSAIYWRDHYTAQVRRLNAISMQYWMPLFFQE
jgi:hypothetical protein